MSKFLKDIFAKHETHKDKNWGNFTDIFFAQILNIHTNVSTFSLNLFIYLFIFLTFRFSFKDFKIPNINFCCIVEIGL